MTRFAAGPTALLLFTLGACGVPGPERLDGPEAETMARGLSIVRAAQPVRITPSRLRIAPRLSVQVEPLQDGAVTYKALAGADGRGQETYKLVVGLRLQNDAESAVEVDRILVDFPGTTRPGVTMADVSVPLAGGAAAWWSSGRTASGTNAMFMSGPMPSSVRIRIGAAGFGGMWSMTFPLARHVHPVDGDAYRLPFASGELRTDEYYETRAQHWANGGAVGLQINAYDIDAKGFDSATGWSIRLPGTNGDANDHYRIWNKPYRAMADGVVVDWSDGLADNTTLGALPSPTPSPVAGNFLSIRHGDEIVTYAHFRNGTIPSALKQTNAPVNEGQFLGRVGNSGNSSRPHVHIHVSSDTRRLRPFAFRDTWGVETALVASGQTSGGWFRLNNHGPSANDMLLWPASTLGAPVAVAGISRQGSWASRIFIRSSLAAFEAEAQHLFDTQGKRLVWVSTYVQNAHRYWVGIADSGSWASRFWVSSSRSAFEATAQAHFNRSGLRLTHVHTFVENGRTYFVGLARGGTWANRLITASSRTAFVQAAQAAFDKDGLRLVHVHTFMENGSRVWMGIARSGTWANRLFFASSPSSFIDTAQTFFDEERLRTTFLHTYVDSGTRHWVGIARSGNWANRVHVSPDVDSHVLEVQRLFDQEGKRPVLFEPLGPR